MRKLVLLIAVAVAVAIGISLSTLKAQVRRAVTALVEERAADGQTRVAIGEVAIAIWPRPAVTVHEVRMTRRAGERVIFAAPAVRVYPRLLGLLIGRARVGRVEAMGPEMVARRELRDGRPVLVFPIGAGGVPGLPAFSLAVSGARLRFEDAVYDPPTVLQVEELRFDAEPADDAGWMELRAAAPALGPGSKVEVHGRFRPEPAGDAVARVDVRFTAEGVDPAILKLFSPRLADVPFTGPLSFTGAATGPLGTRSTEIEPAEPLTGSMEARIDLKVLERTAPLEAKFEILLDDRRFQIKDGTFRWNDLTLAASGWWETDRAGKLGARVELSEIDLAAALAGVGVREDRRPSGKLTAVVRVSGPRTDPRIHYDASFPRLELAGPQRGRLEAVDGKATGSLFALNADISGSFQVARVALGGAEIRDVRIGATYWQDKLSLAQRAFPIWGGEIDFSAAYYPSRGSVEGGGLANNLDVAALAANLPVERRPDVTGRADLIFHFGYDSRGVWAMGRVGLHRGRLGPRGLGRELIAAIGAAQGDSNLVSEDLVEAYPALLAADGIGFRRLTFDFERREEAFVVRALRIDLADGEVRAEGVLDPDGKIAGWGTLYLSGKASAELAARLPALRALTPGDGRLRVPLKLASSDTGLEALVEERFLDALARAARGESAGAFVPVDPDSGIVMDLPSLEEQFYR